MTLANIEIRQAQIDDLAAIFHLGEQVFTPQDVANLYRTWDEVEITGLFNSEPENIRVAEQNDQVIGFAMGTTINKAGSAWSYGHLLWLGVAPTFARAGIGDLLFSRFKELMQEKGIRILLVDTQADNDPALAFFRRQGFENPTDHVYMTMHLRKDS